jgi:hypothetical protein
MFNLPSRTPMGELELFETFEFFDFPRLFSAKSRTGALYLALSIFDDYDEFEWLYISISVERIKELINKKICLHTVFSQPENGFLFKVHTNSNEVLQCEYILSEQLSSEELPLVGAKLDIKCNSKHYGLGEINPKVAAKAAARETFNIHLYPWDTKLPELGARSLGNILIFTQELIDALGQYCETGEPTIKGAIPLEILQQTKLNTCQIFESSFGIQLKSTDMSDLFTDSLSGKAIKEFFGLLLAEDNEDFLSNKLHLLKGRVASKYRRLLKEIISLGSGVKFDWGSPKPEHGGTFELTKSQVENAHAIVDKIDIEMSEAIEVSATLIGLNIRTNRYEILETATNERYSGKVSLEAIGKIEHAVINKNYIATLKKLVETKSSSGDETIKWVLIDLKIS